MHIFGIFIDDATVAADADVVKVGCVWGTKSRLCNIFEDCVADVPFAVLVETCQGVYLDSFRVLAGLWFGQAGAMVRLLEDV